MKVISLLQPWASLVVLGQKKIETRSFNTQYRGPLLIHASKSRKGMFVMDNHDFERHITGGRLVCHFGAIIGQVNLDLTTRFDEADGLILTDKERAFGDFTPGRFGWLLSNPVQFDEPIHAKGQLGFWNYDMTLPLIRLELHINGKAVAVLETSERLRKVDEMKLKAQFADDIFHADRWELFLVLPSNMNDKRQVMLYDLSD